MNKLEFIELYNELQEKIEALEERFVDAAHLCNWFRSYLRDDLHLPEDHISFSHLFSLEYPFKNSTRAGRSSRALRRPDHEALPSRRQP